MDSEKGKQHFALLCTSKVRDLYPGIVEATAQDKGNVHIETKQTADLQTLSTDQRQATKSYTSTGPNIQITTGTKLECDQVAYLFTFLIIYYT